MLITRLRKSIQNTTSVITQELPPDKLRKRISSSGNIKPLLCVMNVLKAKSSFRNILTGTRRHSRTVQKNLKFLSNYACGIGLTILDKYELKRFKEEVYATYSNGKRKYQQVAPYILMLNTGMRSCEALGLKNSDIDLEKKQLHIRNSIKEIYKREGTKALGGRTTKVGKTKTPTSKRTIPLNNSSIEAIKELRQEYYFGEDAPLICDGHGNYTNPTNFRKRFYRILDAAGIKRKGLHSLRHTFATNLVNGVKQPDGTIRALTPKQVADLLGHTTSQITELYYVKKDTSRLSGVTDGFEI